MRQKKIEELKNRLMELRKEHYAEIRQHNQEAADLGDSGVPDPGDAGVSDDLRENMHLLSDTKREELLRIDEALDKIGNGTYGLCETCEEPISIERLEVRPFARYCIQCKEEIEKQESKRKGVEEGKL